MNGMADPTDHRFATPDLPERQGRHRHAPGAGTWTPAVTTAPRRRRRATPDATVTGSLPLPPTRRPAGPPPAPDFVAARGELPIPSPAPGEAEEPTVRRKKITLTRPDRTPRQDDDEARVYVAPPPDGLGTFDLGSVPASVTPPRSWRKAAWFASISSGGVVVALLVAGTLLVGQPPPDRRVAEGWPDRHGGVAPLLPHEGYADNETGYLTEDSAPTSTTAPTTTETTGSSTDNQAELRSPSTSAARSSVSQTSDAPSSTPPTSSAPPLQKPPVTRAPTTKAQTRYVPFEPYDADTMGERSQDYLDLVTEDADSAHELTTGQLASEGAEGLREKYADVAYFVVKHIYVDQNDGYTVNTVEVTHTDGTTTEETRKLVFTNDSKIADDGQ
ncbi:hypothetical protein ABZ863_00030 [Saccharomonospora sp. NPDC046836]|uniref:hypothetical protein n=1 Tax=Saccharomonospora sp. NPDC046836 TaxID=3156921 RepID=UPI0033CA172F